jgi:hypothetical protein
MDLRLKYLGLQTKQEPIFEGGIHVGFKVALKMQKGATIHQETVDVVVGAQKAAELVAGSMEDFTAWVFQQILDHSLVEKSYEVLDPIPY